MSAFREVCHAHYYQTSLKFERFSHLRRVQPLNLTMGSKCCCCKLTARGCNNFAHCIQSCSAICKTCGEIECHHPRCFQRLCFPTCYICCPCFQKEDEPKPSEDPVPLILSITEKRYKQQIEKQIDNQAVREIYFLSTLVTVFCWANIFIYIFGDVIVPHVIPIYKIFKPDIPWWYTCYELTDECTWDPGRTNSDCHLSLACVGTWHVLSMFTVFSEVGMATYIMFKWPDALYTGHHELQTMLHLVVFTVVIIIVIFYFEGSQVWQTTIRDAPNYQWVTILGATSTAIPGFFLGSILIYRLTKYLNLTWDWRQYNVRTEQDVVSLVKMAYTTGGTVRCRGSKHS